jgi:hypothetical protein
MHSVVFASLLAVASAGVIAPTNLVYSSGITVPGVTSTQFHAQDELGQYSYGYSGGPSSKTESKDAFGNVRGGYSYVDANGIVQNVNYIADPVNGFRVAATNLPVGPSPQGVIAAAPVAAVRSVVAGPVTYAASPVTYAAQPISVAAAPTHPGQLGPVHIAPLPLPPADTPEVQLAKIQHFQAKNEALIRTGF